MKDTVFRDLLMAAIITGIVVAFIPTKNLMNRLASLLIGGAATMIMINAIEGTDDGN